jgi:hypothetical protein
LGTEIVTDLDIIPVSAEDVLSLVGIFLAIVAAILTISTAVGAWLLGKTYRDHVDELRRIDALFSSMNQAIADSNIERQREERLNLNARRVIRSLLGTLRNYERLLFEKLPARAKGVNTLALRSELDASFDLRTLELEWLAASREEWVPRLDQLSELGDIGTATFVRQVLDDALFPDVDLNLRLCEDRIRRKLVRD